MKMNLKILPAKCGPFCSALIYLPLEKMAAVVADDNFKCIFLNENNKISSRSPIDNKQALVQVMAWRRTGDKPLPESMLTWFTDAYMRHQGEMS